MRQLMVLGLLMVVLNNVALGDVIISDCETAAAWDGVVTAGTEQVKEGAKSLRWAYAEAPIIKLKETPADWSSGNALAFWLYSEKELEHRPWLIVRREQVAPGTAEMSYAIPWSTFSGWYRIVIPFEEFAHRTGLATWDNIAEIEFDSTRQAGRRPPADPTTVLYIDDIRVIDLKTPGIGEGPRLTDEEFFEALDLGRPELGAVKAAVDKDDLPAARHAFAEHIRTRQQPRWFSDWLDAPAEKREAYALKRAEAYLRDEFIVGEFTYQAEGRIDWNYYPEAYREGPLKTNEYNALMNRFSYLKYLHSGWWFTKEAKYVEKIVEHIVSWVEDCPVLLFQSGNGPYHYAWETLNCAGRLGHYWPHAIYTTLAHPAWTDDAIIKVWKSLYEHSEHLMKWPSKGNWLTSESRAIYFTGLMNPEYKRAGEWRETAITRLYGQLDEQVYPDGLQYELALGYNMGVLHSFGEVLRLAYLNEIQGELPADYLGKMEKMYNYLLYAMMPNGEVPGRNDAYNADPSGRLKRAAAYFPERQDFLWGATGGAEGVEPSSQSVAFPYSGHYCMRTGWEAEADLYLMMDAGPWGAGHQHEDKLGFIVYAYGKQLMLEAGTHQYDHSEERKYVRSTRGHNTIRVDGKDQRCKYLRDTWVLPYPFEPLDNVWVAGDEFDFVEGQYEQGYGGENDFVAARHTRSILFVKPEYWIVTDTVVPEDDAQHSYESIFHLNAETAGVDGLTVSTKDNEGANLQITATARAGLAVKIVEGQEEPELQGWVMKNFNALRPVPTAVYEWQAKGATMVSYVLHPTRPGEVTRPVQVVALKVECEDGKAANGTALEVHFADGARDVYCYGEGAGVMRQFGDLRTNARCALVRLDAEGQVSKFWATGGSVIWAGEELGVPPGGNS